VQGGAIFNEENIPVRLRETVQDITERKKAEEEVKILANAVESSNDGIITQSLDGIIKSWNKGAEQIYGYSAEEILGNDVSILEPANLKGEIKQLIQKIKQEEKIQHYETSRLKKDGTLINASVTLSPVFDTSGKFVAVSCIARDITERKNAEQILANMEIARKKEIHHRIKNNLQVISSLLDLQAEQFKGRKNIKDSEVLEAFRESQDRVISMALIHEELHKGGGLETLNFSPYIQELADNLFQTYRLGDTDISLKMDLVENAFFDMDTAVPLGIIVNELVSNSFKHAFSGRSKGEIRIKLSREENGECIRSINEDSKSTSFTLTISDNGIGIPENIDIEELDSLGLQLVTSLVDQLDGEIELKRNNGTELTMRFTVIDKSDQAQRQPHNS
jgi:PAS domain S-box-containing protein